MTDYVVAARLRPVLVSVAIIALMAANSLNLVLSHDLTRTQFLLGLISAGLFSLWLLRMVHVYGLRLDVDGDSVMLKRFGRRRLLRKNAIRLAKVTFNGRMRIFHFKSNDISFVINENFHNAGVFARDVESKQRE